MRPERVWRAWSDADQVMRWWGPQGFTSPMCRMDFREGGTTVVCMRSAENWELYNTWTYRSIEPMDRISACAASSGSWVDQDERHAAAAVQLGQQLVDLGAGRGVQVAGRLVRGARTVGDSARERDPLLLAARQVRGVVAHARREPHPRGARASWSAARAPAGSGGMATFSSAVKSGSGGGTGTHRSVHRRRGGAGGGRPRRGSGRPSRPLAPGAGRRAVPRRPAEERGLAASSGPVIATNWPRSTCGVTP